MALCSHFYRQILHKQKATDLRWLLHFLRYNTSTQSGFKTLVQLKVWTQHAINAADEHHQTGFEYTVQRH